jgi:hypothetical protein
MPLLRFFPGWHMPGSVSAHDGHVLQEIDRLFLLLFGRNSPEMMEYERHRYQPKGNHQRRVLRFVTCQHQQAATDLDE